MTEATDGLRYAIVRADGRGDDVVRFGATGSFGAAFLREVLGGAFEVVLLRDGSSMYIAEDGKVLGLPMNGVATTVAYQDRAISLADHIVGDAVVVGPPDAEGWDTSLPDEAAGRLSAVAQVSLGRFL